MVKINIDSFSENELMTRYNILTNKEKWLERCEMCDLPGMLHRGPCTRQEETIDYEYNSKTWKKFMERMEMIRKNEAEKMEKNELAMAMKSIAESQHELVKQMAIGSQGNENRTTKIVKPTKVL